MSKLHINTTQNVNLFFTSASIGERMLAYFIDFIIKMVYITIIYLILLKTIGFNSWESDLSEYVYIFFVICLIPVFLYTLLFESIMNGQTPGKRITKLKVVKIDGYQAHFLDYFIRWFFRVIDIDLGYIPGIISFITTKHTQRLGDLAAGTAVISQKSKYNISHTILMDIEETYKPYFSLNQVIIFSDNDIRIIKENAEKALRKKNQELINIIGRKIESVMQIQNPFENYKTLIDLLLKDYNYHTGK